MIALLLTVLIVLAIDQALKHLLHRRKEAGAFALGSVGSVRIVAGQLWITRFREQSNPGMIWAFAAVAAMTIVSLSAPLSPVFVGLLLGGSLSNVLENYFRGRVSDYVCLRFWPAFNFADLALTIGAIGILIELSAAVAVWVL